MDLRIDRMAADRLVLLAAVLAIAACIILAVDLGIKRSILKEAQEIRGFINGEFRGGAGSQERIRQADRGAALYGDRANPNGSSTRSGLRADLAHANGGGIKKAPLIDEPPSRAYLYGDRANNGETGILPAVRPESSSG